MPDRIRPLRRARGPALAAMLLAASIGANAQVYKCVDPAGNVTYQESPCGAGSTGGRIELSTPLAVLPSGDESLWSAAARERKPLVGMPKPFVVAALGEPREIRAPRSGEGGAEVWVYPKGGQVTRIGFAGSGVVAWIRADAVPESASGPVPAADVPGAAMAAAGRPAATMPPGDRAARLREALVVGRPCEAVLAQAGAADREEPLVVGQTAGNATRHVYVLDAKNANAYAAFVCVAGRVTSVERYVPGQ